MGVQNFVSGFAIQAAGFLRHAPEANLGVATHGFVKKTDEVAKDQIKKASQ